MSAGPAITQSVTLGTITNAGPTTIHTSYTPILSYNLEHSRQLYLIIIINAPKIFALYMSNYVCGRKEKVFKLFSSICQTLFSKVVKIVFFFNLLYQSCPDVLLHHLVLLCKDEHLRVQCTEPYCIGELPLFSKQKPHDSRFESVRDRSMPETLRFPQKAFHDAISV